ncbi:hypothetical protein KKF34_06745 [Myxococcota bacterium]|nr:hypothetical protein [Myxococcota bacterium]MBU1380922.1 hypothetical protein [Myxococcota bacterium]MBU1496558.1 hypothetical protein [Myxococcota bacterium]
MKILIFTALLNLIVGCSGKKIENKSTSDSVLTTDNFLKIKKYILEKGKRETYCNMYNYNPVGYFGEFAIFLNPDTGQKNINCEIGRSDFNYMVVKRKEPIGYFRISIENSVLSFDKSEKKLLESFFQKALIQIP